MLGSGRPGLARRAVAYQVKITPEKSGAAFKNMSEKEIDITKDTTVEKLLEAPIDVGETRKTPIDPEEVVEELRSLGWLTYGRAIPAEWFIERIGEQPGTLRFGCALSTVRRELERHGFYLRGSGMHQKPLQIIAAEKNLDQMKGYSHRASDHIKRAVILGEATNRDALTAGDLQRHDGYLARLQNKRALMQRSESIYNAVNKLQPKLIHP